MTPGRQLWPDHSMEGADGVVEGRSGSTQAHHSWVQERETESASEPVHGLAVWLVVFVCDQ